MSLRIIETGVSSVFKIFGFAAMGARLRKTLVANIILSIRDIIFYWLIIGKGVF